MKIERWNNHHINPISVGGYDIPQNIARISESKHTELHAILDMNSRLHYKLVRLAREKTNHKLVMWPEDLKYWHDVQKLYFERLPRLDWFVKKIHLEKINLLAEYESWRLNFIWIDSKHELAQTFQNGLDNFHEKQIELAKAIQFIFKKWLWTNLPMQK